ncbi:hypothetical protein BG015_009610 [Linnemannia schmuckeri]|uniref:F-box domain-containing protein n=1 Tax=Linnemannia schmuckeri TaxID=64567 RepID=A0A9P5RVA1_9FUNG|nr:hypothetical protein BG015_009610 [Linnemannia schmuckeri]
MPDAPVAFFSIPELAAELCSYLTAADFLNLMLTSCEMNSICQPLFWNALFLRNDERTERFTASQDGMASLGRNIDSVRSLQTRGNFLTYYVVGLVEHLRHSTPSSSGSGQLTRPDWVPCEMIEETKHAPPIPPFTKLQRFWASMLYGDMLEWEHYSSRSILRAAPLSLQTCWIMSLNPNLTSIFLHGVDLEDAMVVRCLARTLSRLLRLKSLMVRHCHAAQVTLQVVDTLFRSCPQSIVTLQLPQDIGESGKTEMAMDQDDKDFNEGPLVLRTEPLANLRYLRLPDNYRGYHANQICPFLEQSPRLKTWYVPCIAESADTEAIARTIRTHCKKVKELYNEMPYANYKGEFAMSVMETAMEPQQLERLAFTGYHDEWPGRMVASIQRHDQVLQQIRLQGCHRLMSSTIHAILTSCRALQHLEVAGGYPSRIAISLKDAGSSKEWVCKDLRHLAIYVDVNSIHTGTEQPPWGLLERLYRHIGSLQQLTFLDLRGAAVIFDTAYINSTQEVNYLKLTFPGLLSLGDASTGEPGYLSLLKDLKRLKTLQGSVLLNNVRVQELIGQAEAEWIYENWPSLRLAEFVDLSCHSALEERPYLRWLKERIPRLQFTNMVAPSTWTI